MCNSLEHRGPDSDGFFDYLTIYSGVDIDIKGNYTIYGRLKDSAGNFLDYTDCSELSIGNFDLLLNFKGIAISRNKLDGPYELVSVKLSITSSCDSHNTPLLIDSLANAHTTFAYSYADFQKGKEAVYCDSSPCEASSAIIESKGDLELNSPNTLDSCQDGNSGSHLNSESIESITLTSVDYDFFKTGSNVRVDTWVYCDSIWDNLNLVYANDASDISWEVQSSTYCDSIGLKKISNVFTLGENTGLHAVRGLFGFTLDPNIACGEEDNENNFADADDLVIYIKECELDNHCSASDCSRLTGQINNHIHRYYVDIDNSCNIDMCTDNICNVYSELKMIDL